MASPRSRVASSATPKSASKPASTSKASTSKASNAQATPPQINPTRDVIIFVPGNLTSTLGLHSKHQAMWKPLKWIVDQANPHTKLRQWWHRQKEKLGGLPPKEKTEHSLLEFVTLLYYLNHWIAHEPATNFLEICRILTAVREHNLQDADLSVIEERMARDSFQIMFKKNAFPLLQDENYNGPTDFSVWLEEQDPAFAQQVQTNLPDYQRLIVMATSWLTIRKHSYSDLMFVENQYRFWDWTEVGGADISCLKPFKESLFPGLGNPWLGTLALFMDENATLFFNLFNMLLCSEALQDVTGKNGIEPTEMTPEMWSAHFKVLNVSGFAGSDNHVVKFSESFAKTLKPKVDACFFEPERVQQLYEKLCSGVLYQEFEKLYKEFGKLLQENQRTKQMDNSLEIRLDAWKYLKNRRNEDIIEKPEMVLFTCDWRESQAISGQLLADCITEKTKAGAKKITIVTHSMGGTVARAALGILRDTQQQEKLDAIHEVILIASPNYGFPSMVDLFHGDAYTTMSAFIPNNSDFILGFLQSNPLLRSLVERVCRLVVRHSVMYWPGWFAMLPFFNIPERKQLMQRLSLPSFSKDLFAPLYKASRWTKYLMGKQPPQEDLDTAKALQRLFATPEDTPKTKWYLILGNGVRTPRVRVQRKGRKFSVKTDYTYRGDGIIAQELSVMEGAYVKLINDVGQSLHYDGSHIALLRNTEVLNTIQRIVQDASFENGFWNATPDETPFKPSSN